MEFTVRLGRTVTQIATIDVEAANQRDAAFLAGTRVTEDKWQQVEKIERVFEVKRAEGNGSDE